jgi:uncharacterized protein
VIVLDASVVYALLDAADQRHREARDWYATVDTELATTPLILAEVDDLARSRAGTRAVRAFRDDVRSGAYLVEWWATAAREAADVADRYLDLGVSLADASLVALAARLGTVDVASFDARHFRAMSPLGVADAFRLLPLDTGR